MERCCVGATPIARNRPQVDVRLDREKPPYLPSSPRTRMRRRRDPRQRPARSAAFHQEPVGATCPSTTHRDGRRPGGRFDPLRRHRGRSRQARRPGTGWAARRSVTAICPGSGPLLVAGHGSPSVHRAFSLGLLVPPTVVGWKRLLADGPWPQPSSPTDVAGPQRYTARMLDQCVAQDMVCQ